MDENKYAIIVIVFMAILMIIGSVITVKYKIGMDKALEDFFGTCVKIDDKTIQCPIPK